MRKALTGLATYIDQYGTVHEKATFTCAHCPRVKRVEPFCDPADLGGLCKICMGVICEHCVAKGSCDPYEKKLQRAEKSNDARRWMDECR